MVDLWQLVAEYGYPIVFVLTFFEGETVLVLGGIMAHDHRLELPWVIAAGFWGSLLGDQLWFHIARRYGIRILARRPTWKLRCKRALALLDKYNTLFILSFRFLYGLRTVSSFAVGLTTVSSRRYLVLNTVGAAVWAVSVACAGYLLGEALRGISERLDHYTGAVLLGVAGVAFVFWLCRTLRDRARARNLAAPVSAPARTPPPQNVESD